MSYVDVAVDVDVTVEVFVCVLVDEDDEDDVEVRVLVGASLVGALVDVLVAPDTAGVRVGRLGRLTEREALGRFEPPPHEARSTRAVARTAIEVRRIRRNQLTFRDPLPASTLRPRAG